MAANGREINPMLDWAMTAPINTASRCPVLSTSSGGASKGLSTGIPMEGRTYSDAAAFQAAMAREAAPGGRFADDSGERTI